MLASSQTNYGTETFKINLRDEISKVDKTQSAALCKKGFAAFWVIAFIASCIYVSYKHHGSLVLHSFVSFSDDSDERPSLDYLDTVFTSDNCANDDDISCDGTSVGCVSYAIDIHNVVKHMALRWIGYAQFIEDQTGIVVDSGGCFYDSFVDNQLSCVDTCNSPTAYNNGISEATLCKNSFLDNMKDIRQSYRETCIAAVLSQQFARNCGRTSPTSSQIEKATFLWYKKAFAVASEWKHEDCPYYI